MFQCVKIIKLAKKCMCLSLFNIRTYVFRLVIFYIRTPLIKIHSSSSLPALEHGRLLEWHLCDWRESTCEEVLAVEVVVDSKLHKALAKHKAQHCTPMLSQMLGAVFKTSLSWKYKTKRILMNSYRVLDIRLKCPSPGDALLVDAVLGWQCYIKEWQGVAGNSVVTLHFGDPSTHRSKMFATFLWQMQSYRSCLLYSRGHKTSLSSWVGYSYCINSKKDQRCTKVCLPAAFHTCRS